MKIVAATLGVARSNVIDRSDGRRPRRGPQERRGNVELAGASRAAGDQQVNAKRIYRLMKKHGLTLERHTGRRRPREHDGEVATIRSNCRWWSTSNRPATIAGSPPCSGTSGSDTLEFACWNGEIVRVAFALDCHDREIIGWVASTGGIEMIRDMMSRLRREALRRDPRAALVQWLSDNGSIFAAHKTIEVAVALNSARVSPRSKVRKATAWPRPL